MLVKICGIRRPEDARAAVRLGTDAIGVVFAESPRRVTVDEARAVVDAARAEAQARERRVDVFALFVNESAEVIRDLQASVGFDVAQLHGDESIAFAAGLGGIRVVKAVRVRDHSSLADVQVCVESGACEAVLLDAHDDRVRGGSGKVFDWSVAREAARGARIILAGGLNPDNVHEAVVRVRPYMVDVSSGVETAPGVKDHALVRRFIEEARRSP